MLLIWIFNRSLYIRTNTDNIGVRAILSVNDYVDQGRLGYCKVDSISVAMCMYCFPMHAYMCIALPSPLLLNHYRRSKICYNNTLRTSHNITLL